MAVAVVGCRSSGHVRLPETILEACPRPHQAPPRFYIRHNCLDIYDPYFQIYGLYQFEARAKMASGRSGQCLEWELPRETRRSWFIRSVTLASQAGEQFSISVLLSEAQYQAHNVLAPVIRPSQGS
jgi:hypothetical protein